MYRSREDNVIDDTCITKLVSACTSYTGIMYIPEIISYSGGGSTKVGTMINLCLPRKNNMKTSKNH